MGKSRGWQLVSWEEKIRNTAASTFLTQETTRLCWSFMWRVYALVGSKPFYYVIGKFPIAPWLQMFKVILAKCLKRGSFGKMLKKGFLRTGISVRWTNDFATIKNHPTWMYIIAWQLEHGLIAPLVSILSALPIRLVPLEPWHAAMMEWSLTKNGDALFAPTILYVGQTQKIKCTSYWDVRSMSFLWRADPSSKIAHWPVRITWRSKSDLDSLVRGSANMVLPSIHRILPLSSLISCLIREISMEVRLSPHWEAGLVYLLTAS